MSRLFARAGLLGTFGLFLMQVPPALAQAAASAPKAPKSAPEVNAVPPIMDALFDPMSRLVAASFDKEQFAAKARRPEIEALLTRLATNADRLEHHAVARDRAFEFVAKSLRRDAHTALRRYQHGYYDEARFTLFNMTDNCIACHASLPEGRKFPGADQFFAKIDAKNLPPLELAHFQLMSRQFDEALTTMEKFFESKDVDPALVPLLGAFTTYLKVAIEVKSDFARPQPLLQRLLARPSVPLHVRAQVERWLAALVEFQRTQALSSPSLEKARRIIQDGKALMEYPRDRDGLVHYLTAEAILLRFVQSRPDRGVDVAEAYYLLGTAASISENSFWISRADFYLESAVRLAPAKPFAVKAYRMLEENLVGGFTGSSGTNLPDDVAVLLKELKKIVEEAQGRRI